MKKILVTDGMEKEALASLRAKGYEVTEKFLEPEDLANHIGAFDAIVVRSATKVRQPIIDEAKKGNLKLIIRGGVGVDNIDVAYAEANGIAVRNTPRASTASVAELALAHMFSLARFVGISNYTMRCGEWNKKKYEGVELAGKTLGIIGFGRIGRELASKAHALGMKIVATDVMKVENAPDYAEITTFEDVLKKADFISLHVPMPKDKKPVITAKEIALMKDGAFIINAARGGIIDEEALCDALDSGKLSGAGLDVFAEEPCKNERLLKNPKVSATPHIGGSTKEAQTRIGREIVDIIEGFFA